MDCFQTKHVTRLDLFATQHTMYANFIVALSNIIAAYPAFQAVESPGRLIILHAMVWTSVLMHLSDTKHRLPGIYPFNQFTWYFLQADRFMALYCTAIVIFHVFLQNAPINWNVAVSGLICLALSENYVTSHFWFTILHSLWYFCAFYILLIA